ncbi:response regulator transcription factor [Pedobacter sp. KR3-3]|uniref:Response regulator transcription factor n=1 Tax=Pedobacter albus TaxID=3113905 RepID=A0ABU7I8H7_9SPHI|nr:response regulator transcription factor [Pedobacter sp. KR3-3]MEE1945596.1 response regulator transcription factor [Pedobacter sp. KR3-3]
MKTSIVIVDDHILIAKALSSILANFDQFEVLYECENGKELQERCQHPKNVPDVVLLDISMPIMDGFETAAWLKASHPEVLIMALSMQNDEQSLIKMIKSGAKGYLLKNVHPTALAEALNYLVKNGYYYPEWAANKVFSSLCNESKETDKKDLFSSREKMFLRFTVTEMSYKEIANQMNCSTRTVEGYRDSLFEKLELKTRVGLAVYAIKNGYDS